ncbi:MAG: sulfurtransferase TusA family protein [Thiohalospira sp.]|uniref:sulfurtransferase TusA family protein n=1 Tax=Thiohalospira sp. TaxID=3080549 RepID=UPI00397F7D64
MLALDWFRRSAHRQNHQIASTDYEVELEGGTLRIRRRVTCEGDGCPKPQLLTLKALSLVNAGEGVELVTDNPAAVETIPAMMYSVDGEHVATLQDEQGHWRVYVQRIPGAEE